MPRSSSHFPADITLNPDAVKRNIVCHSITAATSDFPLAIVSNLDAIITNLDAIILNPETIVSSPDAIISNPDAIISNPNAIISNPNAIIPNPESVAIPSDDDNGDNDELAIRITPYGPFGDK